MRLVPLAMALLCTANPPVAEARSPQPPAVNLDCSLKGAGSEKRVLVSITPSLGKVVMSFPQSDDFGDLTLIDGQPPSIAPLMPAQRSDPAYVAQQRRAEIAGRTRDRGAVERDPGHDSIYDGRTPNDIARVAITPDMYSFGIDTTLPARPGQAGPVETSGPQLRFTLDRRTGLLDFYYDGSALTGSCAKAKPWP